ESVRLGALFAAPTLWTPEAYNNIYYQIRRGFYGPDAYRFFGLVNAGDRAYLGVEWGEYFVFQMRFTGRDLEVTGLRRDYRAGGAEVARLHPPILRRSHEGALLLTDWNGRLRYLPTTGAWKRVGPAPKRR